MKRYILTTDNGVVDTDISSHRHIECFHNKNGILYAEDLSGREYKYSTIIDESDTMESFSEVYNV